MRVLPATLAERVGALAEEDGRGDERPMSTTVGPSSGNSRAMLVRTPAENRRRDDA